MDDLKRIILQAAYDMRSNLVYKAESSGYDFRSDHLINELRSLALEKDVILDKLEELAEEGLIELKNLLGDKSLGRPYLCRLTPRGVSEIKNQ